MLKLKYELWHIFDLAINISVKFFKVNLNRILNINK